MCFVLLSNLVLLALLAFSSVLLSLTSAWQSEQQPTWIGPCSQQDKFAVALRVVQCVSGTSKERRPHWWCIGSHDADLDVASFRRPCRLICPSPNWKRDKACISLLRHSLSYRLSGNDVGVTSQNSPRQIFVRWDSAIWPTLRHISPADDVNGHADKHDSSRLSWIGLVGAVLAVILCAVFLSIGICLWKRRRAANLSAQRSEQSAADQPRARITEILPAEKPFDRFEENHVKNAVHPV